MFEMFLLRYPFIQENACKKYGSFMTCDGVVEIDEQGWGTFTCFANEVQVWIKLSEGAVASSGETVSDFNLFLSLI